MVFGTEGKPAGGRFSGKNAARHLESYAGRDDAIGWVMLCANLIGETVANAPWHFENASGKEIPKTRAEAEKGERTAPADLVYLLERPNPWQTWEDLVSLLYIDWLITGDLFCYLWGANGTGKPTALYRMNPSMTEVVPGKKGQPLIVGYEYQVPGMQKIALGAVDMLHMKRPNPHNDYRGAGLIAGDPRAFDMEIALTDTKTNYYEHGARLSGVLETERAMNDGLIRKIRNEFLGRYGGKDNAYKVAVLERGMKFNAISNSAVDAAFGETSKESRDFILAMFGIPKSMLGIEGDRSAPAGQAAEDRREFAENKMRPLIDKFEAAITNHITAPGWELKFCIDYRYQMPVENKLSLAANFATLPGVTVKEVREFAELPPLGDERDDIVLNLPGDNSNESEVKDRALGPEPGRPPNGENTAAIPDPANEKMPADAEAVAKPEEG